MEKSNYYHKKQEFIESQIEILQQNLFSYSEEWTTENEESDNRIPKQVVDPVIRKFLDQLQFLYYQKQKNALEGYIRVEESDFQDPRWIESFPEEWSTLESKIREKVYQAQKEFMEVKEKYEYYKHLNELLLRMNTNNIQKNMLVKNSPVYNEVEKMKSLVVKMTNTLEKKSEFLNKKKNQI
ncbi:16499_t:CDS:2 [Entrophospora sp. SA101]|nr:16499_t:CDS:2 [Entrophospora sp. SA101]CAJ0861143.1 20781_t:CDS:2 [Entrophospora sp. SA101]